MNRLGQAWRALEPEQRLAAVAAMGLFVSMFLPWYSQTNTVVIHNAARATERSLSAFQAFSFVEAAVLLVSAGVLVMLFARAEGRPFQLPGGDGMIVMIAGGWTALLIFYRLLDKPSLQGTERITATVGVQWGIFVALLLALSLAYAGRRMRAAERPEPPARRALPPRRPPAPAAAQTGPAAPGPPAPPAAPAGPAPDAAAPDGLAQQQELEAPKPVPSAPAPADRGPSRPRPRYPPAPSGQMSFEDPPSPSE